MVAPNASLAVGQGEGAPPLLPALVAMTAVQAAIAAAMFAPGVIAPRIGLSPWDLAVFSVLVLGTAMLVAGRGGAWAARWGSMRTAAFVCLCAAAGLCVAAASSLPALMVAGLLLGLAFGPETPASAALLSRLAKPQDRPLVFSVRQTGNQIGAALGSLGLPVLVSLADPMLGYGAVALAALGVALACLLLSARYDGPLRVAGAHGAGAPHGGRIGLRLGRVRLRDVLRNRPLGTLALASAAFGAMQVTLNTFFLSHAVGLGHPYVEAGIALGAAQIAGLLGRLGWGVAVGRLGTARSIIAGLGFGMSAAAVLLALAGPLMSYAMLVALAVALGATVSGWNGVFVAEVARLSPPDRVAETTGAVLSICYAGLLLGPAVMAAMAPLGGLAGGFAVLGVLTAGGAVLLLTGDKA